MLSASPSGTSRSSVGMIVTFDQSIAFDGRAGRRSGRGRAAGQGDARALMRLDRALDDETDVPRGLLGHLPGGVELPPFDLVHALVSLPRCGEEPPARAHPFQPRRLRETNHACQIGSAAKGRRRRFVRQARRHAEIKLKGASKQMVESMSEKQLEDSPRPSARASRSMSADLTSVKLSARSRSIFLPIAGRFRPKSDHARYPLDDRIKFCASSL